MTVEPMSNDDDACVMDPTTAECQDYVYPLDLIHEDNIALCVTEGSGMPWMPGCSIRDACNVGYLIPSAFFHGSNASLGNGSQ